MDALLEKVAAKKDNPEIWDIFAEYYGGLGEKKKRIEFLEKRLRAAKKAGWEVSIVVYQILDFVQFRYISTRDIFIVQNILNFIHEKLLYISYGFGGRIFVVVWQLV